MFNRLKKPAQRATWSRFKAQAEYLDEVDELGDTAYWLEGVAPSKVADFAGEAAAQDVDTLSRYGDAKKLALVACLAHTARMQRPRRPGRDAVQAGGVHRQEGEDRAGGDPAAAAGGVGAADRHLPHRPGAPRPGRRGRRPGAGAGSGPRGGRGRGGRRVRRPAVGHRGGVGLPRRQLRGAGAAVLPQGPRRDVRAGRQAGPGGHLQRRLGAGRARSTPAPTMPRGATTSRCRRPPTAKTTDSGIAFASGNWRRAVTDRRRPGMVVRRHFEAMVFTYLAEELRTGDIAVAGRRGVRRLAGEPAALGGVRAAAGGVLRRGRAARDGGRVHRAAAARPPGRGRARWTPGTRTTPTW